MCVSAFVSPGVCEGDELPIQCNWSLIVLDGSDVHSKPQRQNKLGVRLPASQLIGNPFLWVNLLRLLVLVEANMCLFGGGGGVIDVLILCERSEGR